jgi:hypothetical protein
MPGGYGTVGTPWGSSGSSYQSSSKPLSSYTYKRPQQSPFTSDVNYSSGYTGSGWNNPQSTGFRPSSTGDGGNWMDIFGGSSGMTGIGDLFGGIGGLAQGWGALKDAKLAREAFAQQQKQWEMNYESQRLVTNNAIANQNAWKQAQGRTDYGSYVGGKPAGTQYVG